MKRQIKRMIESILRRVVAFSRRSRVGTYMVDWIVSDAMKQTVEIEHDGIKMTFSCPNSLNRWRADSFSEKEPETLEWIDSIEDGAVLWDIGANVGLYSIYAAKKKGCRVYAFEPSVFNLELLARNVWLNDLTDRITLIPLPLTDGLCISRLNMSSMEWGGALSTFGAEFGHDGNKLDKLFEFQTVGISMQHAAGSLDVPLPDYIKMDVDGIEHIILKGGAPIMNRVKEILVEINDDFSEQAEQSSAILTKADFVLREKRMSEMLRKELMGSPFQHTYNQIWQRRGAGGN